MRNNRWQKLTAALGVMALALGLQLAGAAGAASASAPVLFADGFESGSTGAWSTGTGLVVGAAAPVADGTYAARATMTGAAAYVQRTLATTTTEATTSVKVNLASISGTSSVNFLKLRTATGTALAEVFITPSRVLGLRNDVTAAATNSTTIVTTGTWHTVTLHAIIAGTTSTLDVTYDGTPLATLGSTTANLGTIPIGRIQIGENLTGRTADLSYDTITVTGPEPTPTPSGDPVLMAAGDIACDPLNSAFNGGAGTGNACQMNAVGQLVMDDPAVTAVAALGDVQYECGGLAAFNASYDQTWGRFKAMTYPAVGNHEYIKSSTTTPATDCDATGTAAGYFQYFGVRAGPDGTGYYSYDLGTWHIIVLNTTCDAGPSVGCGPGSPQEAWLRSDLAAHPNKCTLAYFHIPVWTSGGRSANNARTFQQDLYDAGAEVVLAGHDHTYERFALQDPSGNPDPKGLQAFVVGTGGANHTTMAAPMSNSLVRDDRTFGVLRLELHEGSYDWRFIPVPGGTLTDSGTANCH
jgi:Calcineurin-like phosphoesterase